MDFNRQIALQQQPSGKDDGDSNIPAPFLATLAFLSACQDQSNGQAVAHRYETTYLRHYNRAPRNFLELKAARNSTDGLEPMPSPASAAAIGRTPPKPKPRRRKPQPEKSDFCRKVPIPKSDTGHPRAVIESSRPRT